MNSIAKNSFLAGALMMVCLAGNSPLYAQSDKKPAAKKTVKPASAAKAGKDGFIKLASGLEYKIVTHGKGTRKPQLTDHIELNISYAIGDSMVFSSRKMNGDKPVPLQVGAPKFVGDPIEVFQLMVAGDSAVIRYPVDSMKNKGQAPPWAKPGDFVKYYAVITSVKSDAEDKKENEEKSAKQKVIDEKLLQEYFKAKNIKANKTASGLYYTIESAGSGDNIKAGQNVAVNYTGALMNGKKFDSNTDSAFHHMQPFKVDVGRGRVIKGWDEGLQLLKKGSKATFYIPSNLAYGSREGNAQIPPNSILVFNVEILDMPDQGKVDEALIKDYVAKNNLKATRTPSGLYYVVTQEGLGPKAAPNKKVTMNYTGKLLDGTPFDSNTDPKFNHVQPFQFTLGQGQVIRGWDEGVQLLKLGSKATFIIPSDMAYGDRGTGPIPANAVLVFDVEVTSID